MSRCVIFEKGFWMSKSVAALSAVIGLVLIILVVVVGLVAFQPHPPGLATSSSSDVDPGSAMHEASLELLLVERRNILSASSERGAPCSGTGSYSDLRGGAPVHVLNDRGDIIASAPVEEALVSRTPTTVEIACLFTATISVPKSDYYEFQVARRSGGPLYSHEELEEAGWRVELSIGA
jgi:hypothetical protein